MESGAYQGEAPTLSDQEILEQRVSNLLIKIGTRYKMLEAGLGLEPEDDERLAMLQRLGDATAKHLAEIREGMNVTNGDKKSTWRPNRTEARRSLRQLGK